MEISPTDYDVIVLGTGITESIIAAACSRVGKSVLHLDTNRFYGEQWTSFTLGQFEKLAKKEEEEVGEKEGGVKYCKFLKNVVIENYVVDCTEEEEKEEEEEEVVEVKESEEDKKIKDEDVAEEIALESNCEDNREATEVSTSLETPSGDTSECTKKKWTTAEFEKSKRRVNIDITPKLVFSNGSMVNLLRDSNCSRYLEFKAINRCFVYHDNNLVKAPCNRAEVFSSTKLKILEKRLLMKFITFAMELDPESDECKSWKGQSDLELFKKFNLTDDLIQLIKSSLVRTNRVDVDAQDVLRHTKMFLKSVGVYGNLPFIFPIYGSGELPQAFARFSAVFGSVYVLDMGVEDVSINDEGLFESLMLSNKQIITAKACVVSPNYKSPKFTARDVNDIRISHAILILDQSVKPVDSEDDKDDISIMTFLPGQLSNTNIITLYEFGPGSYVPSQGQYLVQIEMRAESGSPVTDLKLFVQALLEVSGEAECLWAAYFSTLMKEEGKGGDVVCDQNVYYTSRPVFNSCYDDCIIEGKDIFNRIYEGEEFLPMAPNPEDIKWPDEEEEKGDEKVDEEKEKENRVEEFDKRDEENQVVCEEDKEREKEDKIVDSNITENF